MSFKHKYTYDEKAKILLEYQAGVEHMQFVRDLLYPGWRQIYGL